MGVIVDPETGRLVSALAEKTDIDAQVRALVPLGDRLLEPGFGSLLFEAFDGDDSTVGQLEASIQAALLDSPFYAVRNVIVQREGSDGLRVDTTIEPGAGS